MVAPSEGSTFNGFLALVVLLAIPLAAVIIAVVTGLYRLAVARHMRAGGASTGPATEAGAAIAGPELAIGVLDVDRATNVSLGTTGRAARRSLIRLAFIYVAAGCTYAGVAAVLSLVLSDIELSPLRLLVMWVRFAWAVPATLALVAFERWSSRLALIGAFVFAELALDIGLVVIGVSDNPPGLVLVTAMMWAGIQLIVLLILGVRSLRSVGLSALVLAFGLVLSVLAPFQLLGAIVLETENPAFMSGFGILAVLVGVFTLMVTVGAALWLGLRYRAKRMTELSLTLDSWWLVATLVQIVLEWSSAGWAAPLFLLAFVAYKFVAWFGLVAFGSARSTTAAPRLLLLRVFGHTRRSQRLLDRLGVRWRHAGPIHLIAGTDVAASCLEPDEVIQFLAGRLGRLFLASEAQLQARLKALDERPGTDGRYRVHEYFCRNDVWQAAVREVAARCEVVLMDLRGFTREHRGCRFELRMLLAEVPLERVRLLIDESVEEGALRQLIATEWNSLPTSAPNRAAPAPMLRILRTAKKGDARGLTRELFAIVDASPRQTPHAV